MQNYFLSDPAYTNAGKNRFSSSIDAATSKYEA